MQKELVSILTPCYNNGTILHHLLDSILMQDYPYIEMFAIDDGSIDNTANVIKSYIPKFESKGYSLTYIYQQNSGQSAAINNGLKLINGEYLIWPDSDDYFSSDSAISIYVSELAGNSGDYAIVRSLPTYVSENEYKIISQLPMTQEFSAENQFLNCLYSRDFFWAPPMIKMEAFTTVNPNKEIYVEKNAGQNWQMLLPLFFSYKCITLNKYLFNILLKESSHSRGQYSTYEEIIIRITSYRNTLLNTIETIIPMSDSDKLRYKKEINKIYDLQELELSVRYGKSKNEKRLITQLKADNIEIPYKELYKIKLRKSFIGELIHYILSFFRLIKKSIGK